MAMLDQGGEQVGASQSCCPTPRYNVRMVYFGKYHDGKIIPEGELRLPEGSRVRIEPVAPARAQAGPDPADDLASEAVDFGIPDLASQHDHYLYGTEKRPQNGSESH